MSQVHPYSDASCAVVSLASTSLAWSDRTAPRLCLLQLLAHSYMYITDFITMHAATNYFGLLGGRTACYILFCFVGWTYYYILFWFVGWT